MRQTLSLVLCVGIVIISGAALMYDTARAQFDDFASSNNTPTLRLDPPFPESNETVRITVDTAALTASGVRISWFINGIEEPTYQDQRTITLVTPSGDATTEVRAQINTSSGARSTQITLAPTNVDLVLESNTITPAFYQGKALPSAGSLARVIAIPHFSQDSASLFYTWRVNNSVVHGGRTRGLQSIQTRLENGTEQIITVEIENAAGAVLARKSLVVDAFDPELRFYEQSPLRGTHAVSANETLQMSSEEIGIAAVPYFMSPSTRNTDNAEHTWRIAGKKVTNPSADPFFIALRGSGGGSTRLSFAVQSLEDFLQHTTGDVRINFGQ